jgi:hypothetical protein
MFVQKSVAERIPVSIHQKHIIHKAIEWKGMLDEGIVTSSNEMARRERLSRARVTQVMNLLKLPEAVKMFLASLDDSREIREHSERKLRNGWFSAKKENNA